MVFEDTYWSTPEVIRPYFDHEVQAIEVVGADRATLERGSSHAESMGYPDEPPWDVIVVRIENDAAKHQVVFVGAGGSMGLLQDLADQVLETVEVR
jgi:hypothetical protein